MSFSTFGEIMVRLTPADGLGKLLTANTLKLGFAGAESNVASSLALLGNNSQFISKLPDNPLGRAAVNSLRGFGVSTKNLHFGGHRMGTYYIEMGTSIRPSRVLYDRAASSISEISSGEFDWENILKDQKWLHLSGITPALSPQCAAECITAAKVAKRLGVKISFDLNYRRSLWEDKSKAKRVFDQILDHTDLLFANLGALADVYDLKFSGTDLIDQTKKAIVQAKQQFGLRQLAFTVRDHISASSNSVTGVYLNEGDPCVSSSYQIEITDRFGAGDAFAAACLHAIEKRSWDEERIVGFAAAAFALKHTVPGDIHTNNEQEILSVADGDLSGHVLR